MISLPGILRHTSKKESMRVSNYVTKNSNFALILTSSVNRVKPHEKEEKEERIY